MEASGVSVSHAQTPRHAHLGATIEGALNVDRPEHIGEDIFWPEVRKFLHRIPFRERERWPNWSSHSCLAGVAPESTLKRFIPAIGLRVMWASSHTNHGMSHTSLFYCKKSF